MQEVSKTTQHTSKVLVTPSLTPKHFLLVMREGNVVSLRSFCIQLIVVKMASVHSLLTPQSGNHEFVAVQVQSHPYGITEMCSTDLHAYPTYMQ